MYATWGMFKAATGGEPGPSDDFPTLVQRSHSSSTGGTIARSITLPASISVGQLIVIVISLQAGTITTPPSGYTLLSGLTGGSPIYYKTASGSEGSTVVSWNISSSSNFSNHYALVFDDASQLEAETDLSAGSDPDPLPITVSWGVDKNLFLTVVLNVESGGTLSAYPANCSLYNFSDTTGLKGYLAGATSEVSATFAPNSYDTTDATNHRVWTIGLRG